MRFIMNVFVVLIFLIWCGLVLQCAWRRTVRNAVVNQTNASNAKLAIKRTRKDSAVCLHAICIYDRCCILYPTVYSKLNAVLMNCTYFVIKLAESCQGILILKTAPSFRYMMLLVLRRWVICDIICCPTSFWSAQAFMYWLM